MQKYSFTFFLLIVLLFCSCSPSRESMAEKFDQPLYDLILQLEADTDFKFVAFLAKCEVEPSYEMKKEIDYTGVDVERFAAKTFRAIGTYEQILKISQLSFIYSLELAK